MPRRTCMTFLMNLVTYHSILSSIYIRRLLLALTCHVVCTYVVCAYIGQLQLQLQLYFIRLLVTIG